jgi:hypothetical protein
LSSEFWICAGFGDSVWFLSIKRVVLFSRNGPWCIFLFYCEVNLVRAGCAYSLLYRKAVLLFNSHTLTCQNNLDLLIFLVLVKLMPAAMVTDETNNVWLIISHECSWFNFFIFMMKFITFSSFAFICKLQIL